MYQVEITEPAKQDIRENHAWWSRHRSAEQAERWYRGVIAVMYDLADTAEVHAYATESVLREVGVRQVSFGLGRKPSHRVLYAIRGDAVVVYRVRAMKQDRIGSGDLE